MQLANALGNSYSKVVATVPLQGSSREEFRRGR